MDEGVLRHSISATLVSEEGLPFFIYRSTNPDKDDIDGRFVVIDAVDDPIGPNSIGPVTSEVEMEWVPCQR
jgi:hypothetical protein